MKILLFGAAGQLGIELQRALATLGEVVAATRNGLLPDMRPCAVADFDKPQSLGELIERIAPDVVVNAAAYTAVDQAEVDQVTAFRVNAEAPLAVAQACARIDALLVHFSTDYVFDGTETRPYRESDPVNPLGVYGASKLAGEQAIQAIGARHMIFRTAWVYAPHGRNFLRTMLRLAGEHEELRVVADQFGSPTPASFLADTTARILSRSLRESGLWHLTTSGHTSWQGFAQAIIQRAHALGLIASEPPVTGINTSEYPRPAVRPKWSVLDCQSLDRRFDIQRISWQQGLEQVLIQLLR
jgi:dTDP-4-dehydrorhamnose reductase